MRFRVLSIFLALALAAAACAGAETPSPDVAVDDDEPTATEPEPEPETETETDAEAQADSDVAQPITIVDDVGRVIELEGPAETVVAYNNYNQEFIRALGAADKVVAVSDSQPDQPDYWGDLPLEATAGSQGEPNWEQLAATDPDVVILPRNGAWQEAVEQLEPFGIKVIVITGWDVLKHTQNVSSLGLILGRQAEAERFNEFHERWTNILEERIADVGRVPVYWETGTEYHTVVPGSGWHDMIEAAKGQNIFADVTSSVIEASEGGSVHSYEIDPEAVLLREPEVIINRGHSNFESSSEELLQPLLEMPERPGWDELPAIQDQRVHSITRFAAGAVSKLIGALYLAKWLHPEAMEDVDPNEAFREWIEDFQGLPMPDPSSHTASLANAS